MAEIRVTPLDCLHMLLDERAYLREDLVRFEPLRFPAAPASDEQGSRLRGGTPYSLPPLFFPGKDQSK